MSTNYVRPDTNPVKINTQVVEDCDLSSDCVEPDYRLYEHLKRRLSPRLTDSEYTNAVRRIARECGL